MNFSHPGVGMFVPDGVPTEAALARVTHLGIGAHQDDLEFMAFHGIIACYHSTSEWFGGVTCTDGRGSPRKGAYASLDDEEMRVVRQREQDLAARIGRYGVMVQLGHPSAAVKDRGRPGWREDLLALLRVTRPRVVYTHNLADKHDTHVAVAVATVAAIRALPPGERPTAVYGCEVWRDLDWLPDAEKVAHDVGGFEALAAALNGVFDSQIAGGKRYDLGVIGRRRANATFFDSHVVDLAAQIAFAMDLTPLARDETLDLATYVDGLVDCFREDVKTRLSAQLRR